MKVRCSGRGCPRKTAMSTPARKCGSSACAGSSAGCARAPASTWPSRGLATSGATCASSCARKKRAAAARLLPLSRRAQAQEVPVTGVRQLVLVLVLGLASFGALFAAAQGRQRFEPRAQPGRQARRQGGGARGRQRERGGPRPRRAAAGHARAQAPAGASAGSRSRSRSPSWRPRWSTRSLPPRRSTTRRRPLPPTLHRLRRATRARASTTPADPMSEHTPTKAPPRRRRAPTEVAGHRLLRPLEGSHATWEIPSDDPNRMQLLVLGRARKGQERSARTAFHRQLRARTSLLPSAPGLDRRRRGEPARPLRGGVAPARASALVADRRGAARPGAGIPAAHGRGRRSRRRAHALADPHRPHAARRVRGVRPARLGLAHRLRHRPQPAAARVRACRLPVPRGAARRAAAAREQRLLAGLHRPHLPVRIGAVRTPVEPRGHAGPAARDAAAPHGGPAGAARCRGCRARLRAVEDAGGAARARPARWCARSARRSASCTTARDRPAATAAAASAAAPPTPRSRFAARSPWP